MKKVKPAKEKGAAFAFDYASVMDSLDKNARLVQGSMSAESRLGSTISTGLLGTDIMLGGGLLGGRWYTVFGGEGSGKSTHIMHLQISAANYKIPIITSHDYEGSSAPDYMEGILEYHSKTMKKTEHLYGLKDNTGKYVIDPKIRYYNPTVAEDFFNPISSLLRKLPDKIFVDGTWFYVWDANKVGRAAAGDRYSKVLYSKYHRLYVEAENGLPQALFFADSYPAMFPEALDDDDAGRGMAAIARAMSENAPKVFSKLRPKNVIIVGANQLRQRPAVMYGDPTYEPAGDTLKFCSSARIKQVARSVPHGKGAIEKEESALYEDADDTYRYVHMKAIKNKISTPYLEAWQRIWVDDGTGTAHGFCPAYDTFQYLKNTGQISGSMKKIKLGFEGLPAITMDWISFKGLILLKSADKTGLLKTLKLKQDPRLRDRCFAQLRSGEGFKKFFENIKSVEKEDD